MSTKDQATRSYYVASPDTIEDTKKRLSRLLNSAQKNDKSSEEKTSTTTSSASQLKLLRASRVQLEETRDTTPQRSRITIRRSSQQVLPRPTMEEIRKSPLLSRSLSPARIRPPRSSTYYERESIFHPSTTSGGGSSGEERGRNSNLSQARHEVKHSSTEDTNKIDIALFSSITSDLSKKILTIGNCHSLHEVKNKYKEIYELASRIGVNNFILFLRDDQGRYEAFDSLNTKHLTQAFVKQYILTPWKENMQNQTATFSTTDRGFETVYDMLSSISPLRPFQSTDRIIIDYFYSVETLHGEREWNLLPSPQQGNEQQENYPITAFSIAIVTEEMEIPFFPFAGFIANNMKEMQYQVQKLQFHSLGQSVLTKIQQLRSTEKHESEILQLHQQFATIENEKQQQRVQSEQSLHEKSFHLQTVESILALNIFLNSTEKITLSDVAMATVKTISGLSHPSRTNSSSSIAGRSRAWIFFVDKTQDGQYELHMMNNSGVAKSFHLTNKRVISALFELEEDKQFASSTSEKPSFIPSSVEVTEPEIIHWIGSNGGDQTFLLREESLSLLRLKFPLISKEETVLSMNGARYECVIFYEYTKEMNTTISRQTCLKYLSEISMIIHSFLRKIILTENQSFQVQMINMHQLLQSSLSFDSLDFQLVQSSIDASISVSNTGEIPNAMDQFAHLNQQISSRLFHLYPQLINDLGCGSIKLLLSKNLLHSLGLTNTDYPGIDPEEDDLQSLNEWFSYQLESSSSNQLTASSSSVRKYSIFNQSNTNSNNNNAEVLIQQLLSPALSNSWLKDLLNDKIVIFNPGKKNHQILLSQGATSSIQTSRGGVVTTLVDPRLSLLQFIDNMDANCSSAMLLPVNTNYGVAILVLFDRKDTFWGSSFPYPATTGMERSNDIGLFNTNYAEIIQQTGLNSTLRSCIHQCIELSNIIFRSIVTASTLSRERQKFQYILNRITRRREKIQLQSLFLQWKFHYHRQQIEKELQERKQWNEFIIELLQYRMKIPQTNLMNASASSSPIIVINKLLESFLQTLERNLGQFYLNDSIIVLSKADAEEDLQTIINKPHVHHMFETVRYQGPVELEFSFQNKFLPVILGHIVITRPRSMKEFTKRDRQLLKDISSVASVIYTALRIGFYVEIKEVDVLKEMTLPMFDHLLPVLLSILDPASENIEDIFYAVIQWLKRMTEAEVVLLKVNNSTILSSGDSTTAQSNGPWLLSSSDIKSKENVLFDKSGSNYLLVPKICRYSLINESSSSIYSFHPAENPTSSSSKIIDVQINYPLNSGESTFGELKLILSGSAPMSEGKATSVNELLNLQKQKIIELMMSLLVQTITIRQDRLSKGNEQVQLKEKLSTIVSNFDIVKDELKQSQRNTDIATADAYSLVKVCSLSSQLLHCYNWTQVADIVWKTLPEILSCSSVLFAVNKDLLFEQITDFIDVEATPTASSEEYHIVWPSSSPTGAGGFDTSNSNLSLNQLLHVQRYFIQPSASQSVILLSIPGSKKVFAALLIFQSIANTATSTATTPIHGNYTIEKIQDIFSSLMSNLLYQSSNKFHSFLKINYLQEQVQLLDQERITKQKVLEDKNTVEREKEKYHQEIVQLQKKIESLHSRMEEELLAKDQIIDQLHKEQDDFKQHSHERLDASAEIVKELEQVKQQLQQEIETVVLNKANVLDLCVKFAYDDRCQPETVLTWLEEIASSRHTSVLYFTNFSQEHSLPELYQKINGLWAAIGEASRTGKSIRFEGNSTDSLAPNLSVVGIHATRGSGSLSMTANKSSLKSRLNIANNTIKPQIYDIFCVPNRAILQMKSQEKYCFIFVKPLGDKYHTAYTDEDIDVLETAANLTARLLAKSISDMTNEDYLSLEKEYRLQKIELQRVITALQYGKELFQKEIHSEGDLWKEIRSSINDIFISKETKYLLSGNSTGLIICEVEIFSQERLLKQQQKIYHRYPPSIVHLIESSKAQLLPQRDQNIVVVPIVANRQFYAVMIFEKKLKPNLSSNPEGGTSYGFNETLQATLADLSSKEQSQSFASNALNRGSPLGMTSGLDLSALFMTKYDEVIASILSNYSSSIVDKILSVKDAFQSIQQASDAVLAVQESKSQIEERLVLEVSSRLQYEAAIKSGLDFLAMACTHRMSIGQLSDLLKKSLVTLTTSMDAYILLPYHCEALTTELLVELNEDPNFSNTFLPPNSSMLSSYYTFLPESPYPVFIHLEEGDMESIAIHNFRPVFLPPESSLNHDVGGGNVTIHGWQSWAFRKTNLWSRGVSLDGGKTDSQSNLYAMSVPFRLSNGLHDLSSDSAKSPLLPAGNTPYPLNSTALLILVRKNLPYNRCDLESASWLGQTLSYCFSLKSDKFATKNRLLEYKSIQREVLSLRSQVSFYQKKQNDYQTVFMNMKEIHRLLSILPSSCQEIMAILREETLHPVSDQEEEITKVKVKEVEKDIMKIFSQQEEEYFQLALQLVFHSNAKITECSENEWSDFLMPMGEAQRFSPRTVHPATAVLPSAIIQGSMGDYPYRMEMNIADFGKITFKFGQLPDPWASTPSLRASRENLSRSRSRDEYQRTGRPKSSVNAISVDEIDSIILKIEKFSSSGLNHQSKHEPLRYFMIQLIPAKSFDGNTKEEEENEQKLQLIIEEKAKRREEYGSFDLTNLYFKLELFYHYLLYYVTWKKEIILLYQYIIQIRYEKLNQQQSYVLELETKASTVEEITAKYETLLQQEKTNQQQVMTKQKTKTKQLETKFLELFSLMSDFSQQLYQVTMKKSVSAHLVNAIPPAVVAVVNQTIQTAHSLLERFVHSQQANSGSVAVDYFSGLVTVFSPTGEEKNAANVSWTSPRGAAHLVTSYLTAAEELLQKPFFHLLLFIDEEFENKYGNSNAFENIFTNLQIPSESLSITIISPSTFTTNASAIGGGNKLVNSIALLLPPRAVHHATDNTNNASWLVFGMSFETKVTKLVYREAMLYLLQLGFILSSHSSILLNQYQLRQVQQELAIKKLQTIDQEKQIERLSLANHFKSLSLSSQEEKLQQLQLKQQKSKLYRQKAMFTDQLIADLTEIVKGLNGASSSIIGGSKGLWARSCSTLLSVVSSHCTVQNCGLILPKDIKRSSSDLNFPTQQRRSEDRHGGTSSNLTEYVVRNITTPIPKSKRRKDSLNAASLLASDYRREEDIRGGGAGRVDDSYYDPDTLLEYANANLEQQNIQDYGNKIYSVANDIIDGHISKIQRIYRLSAASSSSASSQPSSTASYIYLIPIKTAIEVLAILHIHTEFPLPSDPLSSKTGKREENESDSAAGSGMNDVAEIMSLVENSLVYFSDLFASLITAANRIDDIQQVNRQKDSSLKAKDQSQMQLIKQFSSMSHAFQQLKGINQVIAKCFEETLITEDILTSIDQFLHNVSGQLSTFIAAAAAAAPSVASSNPPSNRCLILVNKELLAKMDEFWFQESSSSSFGNNTVTSTRENNLDYYQEIHQKFFLQQQSSLSAMNSSSNNKLVQHFYEELKFPLNPVGVKPFVGTAGSDSYFMVGYILITLDVRPPSALSTSDKDVNDDPNTLLTGSLELILKVIAELLSSMLMSVVKESIAKKKVTLAVETIHEIQQNYETMKQSFDLTTTETTRMKQIIEEQKKWIQLLTNSFQGLSITTSEQQKNFYLTVLSSLNSPTAVSNLEELFWKNQSSFLKYLETLLNESVYLLGGLSYQCNLILLHPKILSTKQLLWIYGGANTGSRLAWNVLPENTKTMIMNLVNNCIEKKKKFSIEIRQIIEESGNSPTIATVRIDVLPLLHSYSLDVIGVLQVIHLLPSNQPSTNNTFTNHPTNLDDTFSLDELDHPAAGTMTAAAAMNNKFGFYNDLSSLFARIISHELIALLIRSSYEQSEAQMINLSTKQEQLSIQHRYNLYYQETWKIFAMITTILSGQFLLLLLPTKNTGGNDTGQAAMNFMSDFLQSVTSNRTGRRASQTSSRPAEREDSATAMLLPMFEEIGIRFFLHEGNNPPPINTLDISTEDAQVLARSYIPLLPIDLDFFPSDQRQSRRSSSKSKKTTAPQYLEIQFIKNQTLLNLEQLLSSSSPNVSNVSNSAAMINHQELQQSVQTHAKDCLELLITFLKSLFNAYYERKNLLLETTQYSTNLQTELLQQQQQYLQVSQEKQEIQQIQQKILQEYSTCQEIANTYAEQYQSLVKEILTTDYIEWKYHLQELASLMEGPKRGEAVTAIVGSQQHQQHQQQQQYQGYFLMLLQLLNQRMIKLFIHRTPSTGGGNTATANSRSGKLQKRLFPLLSQRNSPILKYHLSIFTLLPPSSPEDQQHQQPPNTTKDSFKVRMYDQNQDSQDLTIIHYSAIHRYARSSSGSITTAAAVSAAAGNERQSMVEKAFEINSVLFEESYSEENRQSNPLSMTDLIGIQDPDYHYSIYSSTPSSSTSKGRGETHSSPARLQLTVMTIGIKYPEGNDNQQIKKKSRSSSTNPMAGKTSNAVLRIVILHELPPANDYEGDSSKQATSNTGEQEIKEQQQQATTSTADTNKKILSEKSFLKQCHQSYAIYENSFLLQHLKNICITFFSYTEMLFHSSQKQTLLQSQTQYYQSNQQEEGQKIEQMKATVSRYRKIYKLIYREANKLLDPPVIGPASGALPRAIHPANLTPLAASQDTCLKLLSLLRSLLKTEGQALLLKDTTTSPETYQVIYTGDAITWPGIEQNTFGVISSYLATTTGHNARASLVESVFFSRKAIVVPNGPVDERYVSKVDGIMGLGTSLLLVPLRGRGGSIVGVILLAKYASDDPTPLKGGIAKEAVSSVFSEEDLILGELMSNFGSLSLYWCQGLGSLHHQLHKTIHKLEKLEKIIQKQQHQA